MNVSRVAELNALVRAAEEQFGLTAELIMENAGQAAYFVLLQEIGIPGKKFSVFCGVGENGGNGLVLARKIHSSGGTVNVFVAGDPGKFQGAARWQFDLVSRLPIPVTPLASIETIKNADLSGDVIIDALDGEPEGEVAGLQREVIECINAGRKPVLSLELPSGVHGDTGKIMGIAVKAAYTVAFGLPKIGHLLFPGYARCGKLYVSHVSLPPLIYETETLKMALNAPAALPPRNSEGHKGSFGDVLFIAGAANYFGAPYFAAAALLKAGGGYARLAAPRSITPFIAVKGSEIVFVPQQETAAGSIALANKGALLELADKVDMVVIGPGLSLNEETQQLARELAQEIRKPLLIDGDGLTAICEHASILKTRQAETILTPHLAEMARITHQSIGDIEADKVTLLQRTARELHAIIVLKGAHSLIGLPDERVFINLSGNSGMATAGAGDVLTGAIAAMFGLGLPIPEAVKKGVFLHGLAGDLAAADKGEDGITAQDLLDYLPRAVKCDREGLNETLRERYRGVRVV